VLMVHARLIALFAAVFVAEVFVAEAASWDESLEAVPLVGYGQLVEGGEHVKGLVKALSVQGSFQVGGVPDLRKLRRKVFEDAAACMTKKGEGARNVFGMPDGSSRTTFATTTQSGQSFGFGMESLFLGPVPSECRDFEESSMALRNLVSGVSNQVFHALDNVCGSQKARGVPFARAKGDADYQSMWDFLSHGEHLEHFHGYQANCTGSNVPTLDLHVDDGLFICLVPALWVSQRTGAISKSRKANTGFFIENSKGEVISPEFVDDGNVLVFMMGEASRTWFGNCPAFRSVPHALELNAGCKNGQNEDYMRLWYGRMFLPPRNAIIEQLDGQTFGDWRLEKIERMAAKTPEYAPQSLTGKRLLDQSHSCDEGEIYCWMNCRSNQTCTNHHVPSSGLVCEKPDGSPAPPEDVHCPTCQVVCPSVTPPPTQPNTPSSAPTICNGYATSMYMLGFSSGVNKKDACTMILFEAWTLDTPAKFAIGTLGTVWFGILVEFVVWSRRWNGKRTNKHSKWLEMTIYMGLYLTQVTFGYFAMLIAMTYSTILFIAIIVGLGIGHMIFNYSTKISESSDPCCQFMECVDQGQENFDKAVPLVSSGCPKTAACCTIDEGDNFSINDTNSGTASDCSESRGV